MSIKIHSQELELEGQLNASELSQTNSIKYELSVPLDNSIIDNWEYFGNTNLICAICSVPPSIFTFVPNASGACSVVEETIFGKNVVHTEWVKGEYLRSIYPAREGYDTFFYCSVEDKKIKEQGHHSLIIKIAAHNFPHAEPNPQITEFFANAMRDAYLKIDKFITSTNAHHPDYSLLTGVTRSNSEQLKKLTHDLMVVGIEEDIATAISSFTLEAPDVFMQAIKPFKMAVDYDLDKYKTLDSFFLATLAGLFTLRWVVLCPKCKGDNNSGEQSLLALKESVHCQLCNIEYSPNLAENVALLFTPNSIIRAVDTAVYCIRNPSSFFHIYMQLYPMAGEKKKQLLHLKEGRYALKLQSSNKNLILITNKKSTKKNMDVSFSKFDTLPDEITIYPEFELTVANDTSFAQKINLITFDRDPYAATSDIVSTHQEFRNLFGLDALRPGLQLGVSSVVLLFTDLLDSTTLYDTKGDVVAFSLVEDHFKLLFTAVNAHHGTLVKTIGDSIMAAFQNEEDALLAAIEMQQQFAKRRVSHQQNLVIRIGIHKGPCILVGANDHLDYFGSTINKAARIEGQSLGDDIIFSDAIMNNEKVKEIISTPQFNVTKFHALLKGLSKSEILYRIKLL